MFLKNLLLGSFLLFYVPSLLFLLLLLHKYSFKIKTHNKSFNHSQFLLSFFLFPSYSSAFSPVQSSDSITPPSHSMASSLGIGCCRGSNGVPKFGIDNRCCRLSGGAPRPVSMKFVGNQSRSGGRTGRIMLATALEAMEPDTAARGLKNWMRLDLEAYGSKSDRGGGRGRGKDAVDASDRVDKWMQDSVAEIVKNLREAPLLVQVFPKRNGDIDDKSIDGETATTTALVTEKKATEEDWPAVKENWEAGETPMPEGLIFVEELGGDEGEEEGRKGREKTTKVWGVVVQGRGVGCGPVCYLLKTTRAGLGTTGPCCTHFCLMRVKNFRETVGSQFKNVWLVQSQSQ